MKEKSIEEKRALLKKLLLEKALSETKRHDLSRGQKAMWFLHKLHQDMVDYNLGFAIKITGEFDVATFKDCIDALGKRHEILKSVYKEDDKGIYYEFEKTKSLTLEERDATEYNETQLLEAIDQEMKIPYDLASDDMVRTVIYHTGANECVFLFCIHHIIYDEWSCLIIIRELLNDYDNRIHAKNDTIPAPSKSYADFVALQKKVLEDDTHKNFWKEYLENHESLQIEIHGDKESLFHVSTDTSDGEMIEYTFESEIIDQIRTIASENVSTVFNFMMSAYQLSLYHYSGQKEFLIGTPVAGRNDLNFYQTIGYFSNIIPIKCAITPSMTFLDFLKENTGEIKQALLHQDFPFNAMVDSFCKERSLTKAPFFNIAFSYYTKKYLYSDLKGLGVASNLSIEEVGLKSQESAFDITFEIKEAPQTATLKLKYKSSKYSRPIMTEFFDCLKQICLSIIKDPTVSISQLLEDKKRKSITLGTQREIEAKDTVFGEFEHQVFKTPSATAVVDKTQKVTYKELYDNVEALSDQLRSSINDQNPHVGILAGSSIAKIEGIFSILKLGATYVPLKMDQGDNQRFVYMIQNARIDSILCDRLHEERLKNLNLDVKILVIEDLLEKEALNLGLSEKVFPENYNTYLMFTSGSTGQPKGVTIHESSILNLVKQQDYISIHPGDGICHLSDYTFDGSTFEIFGALLNGAALHLVDNDVRLSPSRLSTYFKDNNINKGFFTTALFNSLVSNNAEEFLSTFNTLLFGGEQVSTKHVQAALKHVKNENVLVHVYGPTETTTFTTFYPIKEIDPNAKTIPIGKSIAGASTSIRSDLKEIVPFGVIGELYIGGIGLSVDGYYNTNDKAQERFLEHPENPSERLYATGDYGFMLPSGDIVFTGRKDNQLKIRGYRIELGEIEAALYQSGKVEKAIATVRNYNSERAMLLATVQVNDTSVTEKTIKKSLASLLPDYMVPNRILILEDMVLNKNGKIDRTQLDHQIEALLLQKNEDSVGPSTPTEKVVLKILQDVLEVQEIGINDSFFELGGNSLLAMAVLSRVRQELHIELSPSAIFENQTVQSISHYIDTEKPVRSKVRKIKRSNREEHLLD